MSTSKPSPNSSSNSTSGNVSLSVEEIEYLRTGVIKKFKSGLKISSYPKSYADLANDVSEKTNMTVTESFLRNFFYANNTNFRAYNIDALSIYCFGKKWKDIEIGYLVYNYMPDSKSYCNSFLIRKGSIVRYYQSRNGTFDLTMDGTYEAIGNNCYFSFEKSFGQASKNWIIIYGGTNFEENEYFTGISNTVLLDGTPISYKIILKKFTDLEQAMSLFQKGIEIEAEIKHYLLNGFLLGNNKVPDTVKQLANLSGNKTEKFIGEYKLFSSGREDSPYDRVYEDNLKIEAGGLVILTNLLTKENSYGETLTRDENVLQIISYDFNERGERKSIGKIIFLLVNAYGKMALYIPGLCLAFDSTYKPTAYPILICGRTTVDKNEKFVRKYFDKFPKLRLNCLTLYDIEDISKELRNEKLSD